RRRPSEQPLLLTCLLLAGHGALRALASACVGLGALTAHGQAAAVAEALVRADLDLAADVGLHLAAQVALDLVVAFDVVAEGDELLVAQILHAGVTVDLGVLEGRERTGASHAVDVRQGDFHALLARDVDAGDTCHGGFSLRSRSEVWCSRMCPGLRPEVSPVAPRDGLLAVLGSIELCGVSGHVTRGCGPSARSGERIGAAA